MSANTLIALERTFKRELKRIFSRPIYLLATVGVMGFCFVFFLTFFKEGQPEKMPVAVVDMDNSSLSRQFVRNLKTVQHVEVVHKLLSYGEAKDEMQRGNIYAFVYIDRGFASKNLTGRRPAVNFYVNNAYLIAGSLVAKDISYLSLMTSAGIQRQVLRAKGVAESQLLGIIQPVMIETHLIANPWANYGTYLLNVLFPGILELMVLMMSVFCIGVELKERTSKAWLKRAQNSIWIALFGKLLPYTILFTLLGFVGNLLLFKFMHFPLNSSIWTMFLASFLLVLAGQCLGVLFIGVTPVLRDGVTIAGIFGTLGITFAGATFPVEQMPYMLKIFNFLFPLRHYFNVYVDQALNGVKFSHSLLSYIFLLSFLILPLFILGRLKGAAINMHYPVK